jgi:hypothetical protein
MVQMGTNIRRGASFRRAPKLRSWKGAGGHKMVVYGGEAGQELDDVAVAGGDPAPVPGDPELDPDGEPLERAAPVYILDIDNLRWSRMETSCPEECPGLRALHLTTARCHRPQGA